MLNCAETAAVLRNWDNILVLSHASPDGDTLGSACALMRGLLALGKRARFACADTIAPKYGYLFDGMPQEDFAPEHVMTVDVADLSLLGGLREQFEGRIELAVDHHGTHVPFAPQRWVEPHSAATTELVFLLLQELGVGPDRAIADCIYTGLTTDTGCFRYRSVTPRTHRIAAEVIEWGAEAGEITRVMIESKSKAQVEAERIVLDGMEFFCGGKCAMVRVPRSVYETTGAADSDLDGVATLPRQIEGVVIGVTLKEKENGEVKASVRTNLPADSARLCARFGGGGHKGAAGCSFPGITMEKAAAQMTAACEDYLRELNLL